MPRASRLIFPVAAVVLSVLMAVVSEPAFAACTASTTAVAFGNYDTLSPADDDSTGAISVDCDKGDRDPVASINGGSSGSIASRTMLSAGNALGYNLYTSAARNIVWGDGTVGSTVALNFINSAGGVRRYSSTVYGRIPALQPVPAGVYNDTVTVTITF
jgi:spore coat protein U-like protein